MIPSTAVSSTARARCSLTRSAAAAARSRSATRTRSTASATRSASSPSRARSSWPNTAGCRLATCSTPITDPAAVNGTAAIERSPAAVSNPLTGRAAAISGMSVGSCRAATPPAIPAPTGIRIPIATSASSPALARGTRASPTSSSSRIMAAAALSPTLTRSSTSRSV
jgi:hypothetical protein